MVGGRKIESRGDLEGKSEATSRVEPGRNLTGRWRCNRQSVVFAVSPIYENISDIVTLDKWPTKPSFRYVTHIPHNVCCRDAICVTPGEHRPGDPWRRWCLCFFWGFFNLAQGPCRKRSPDPWGLGHGIRHVTLTILRLSSVRLIHGSSHRVGFVAIAQMFGLLVWSASASC